MKLDWVPGWLRAKRLFDAWLRTWGEYPLLPPGLISLADVERDQRALYDLLFGPSQGCQGQAPNGCPWGPSRPA
jgi:hypothetical protein